jgi:hypothetical protein
MTILIKTQHNFAVGCGKPDIYVINCSFEDCAGEYVRFRDRTDYCIVYGSTFTSTGTFVNGNMPFISVPLFNDDNPQNPGPSPRYEYFGTHFLITNNTFIYPDDNSPGTRQVFRFLQSGYNPPGVGLLLNVKEAVILLRGTVQEKQAFMQSNLGINGEEVHFFGNNYVGKGSVHSVVYHAYPSYGAQGRGWDSPINITDAVNSEPVVTTLEQALSFWQH